jgi:pre-mRNA-splicing factor SPF27
MQTYGQNAWLVRNYQLNSELKEVQGALTVQQEQVTEVNRARRVAQESAGEHLTRLEGRWGDLVSSTVQLEMACMAMEGEVHQLRAREAALREEVEALEAAA